MGTFHNRIVEFDQQPIVTMFRQYDNGPHIGAVEEGQRNAREDRGAKTNRTGYYGQGKAREDECSYQETKKEEACS